MVRIYFAGSISQSRDDMGEYARIIAMLSDEHVVTSDVADDELFKREANMTMRQIYGQEMVELAQADVMVAEVSTASLGVGYQIAHAERLGKPVLCLARPGDRISPMIVGSPRLDVAVYDRIGRIGEIVRDFLDRAGFALPDEELDAPLIGEPRRNDDPLEPEAVEPGTDVIDNPALDDSSGHDLGSG